MSLTLLWFSTNNQPEGAQKAIGDWSQEVCITNPSPAIIWTLWEWDDNPPSADWKFLYYEIKFREPDGIFDVPNAALGTYYYIQIDRQMSLCAEVRYVGIWNSNHGETSGLPQITNLRFKEIQ